MDAHEKSESWRALALMSLCGLGIGLFLVLRNTGLYPSVFADEYTYSLYSRLAPWSVSSIPSYLFLALFSTSRFCGDGFLDCARTLNVALLVLSLPFLFAVCRLVTSTGSALFVAVLALLGPANTYTAYFMPDSTYFFGFWVLSWFVLCVAPQREWVLGTGVGLIVGVLALVKMHGMFLFGGIGLFVLWGWLSKTRPFAVGSGFQLVTSMVMAFLSVRLFGGYFLAGPAGFQLLGTVYGDVVTGTRHSTTETLVQGAQLGWGHLMGLGVTFGVPLALTLAPRRAGANPDVDALRTLERYLISMLVVLVVIAAIFSASIAGAGVYEVVTRLHMRYYNFLFPFFAMIAMGHHAVSRAGTSSMEGLSQRLWFAALAVVATWATVTQLRPFTPILTDCPEVRSLAREPGVLITFGVLGASLLLVAAVRPVWGVTAYVWLFAPAAVLVSQFNASSELRERRLPLVQDSAGRFARQVIGPEGGSHLLIVGSDIAGLFRAQFAVDRPGSRFMELGDGQPLDPARVPADIWWVLYIGAHPLLAPTFAPTEALGFSLVRLP